MLITRLERIIEGSIMIVIALVIFRFADNFVIGSITMDTNPKFKKEYHNIYEYCYHGSKILFITNGDNIRTIYPVSHISPEVNYHCESDMIQIKNK